MSNVPLPYKTPAQIHEQIGNIIARKPRIFSMTPEDISALTIRRATDIIASNYLKNKEKIQVLQTEHDAIDYLSRHDLLTELPNRRELDLQIEQQITGKEDVAFMIFDLRNFKTINDTYDHSMGDAALELVAGVCREIVQKFDGMIARTGGDEFIGFFPGYSLENAKQIADEFRTLLATKFKKQEPGNEINIENIPFTAAIGITSLFDSNGSDVQVKQKHLNETQTDLQKSISIALRKADLMAKAAKDVDTGIVSIWDNRYLEEVKLSPENKKLRDTFDGITRHWISDHDTPENVRQVREILLPYLNFQDSIEELRRIGSHIQELSKNSNTPMSHEFLEVLHREITKLEGLLTKS